MSSEIIISLIGLLGILIGVIPTYLYMRQKNHAEIEKLRAEAAKFNAEAEKIRGESKSNSQSKSLNSQKPIRYRAIIKLLHYRTSRSLHSHSRNYEHPNSSKQQQVTAYASSSDDDYWIVKSLHNYAEAYKSGDVVASGDIIRLEHQKTGKNLHSHPNHPSPVTPQQEVTAYGKGGIGDINDNWIVEVEDNDIWLEGLNIRLIHQSTGTALHSHKGHFLPDWGYHQQEVTCFKERNQDDLWSAAIHKEPKILGSG